MQILNRNSSRFTAVLNDFQHTLHRSLGKHLFSILIPVRASGMTGATASLICCLSGFTVHRLFDICPEVRFKYSEICGAWW